MYAFLRWYTQLIIHELWLSHRWIIIVMWIGVWLNNKKSDQRYQVIHFKWMKTYKTLLNMVKSIINATLFSLGKRNVYYIFYWNGCVMWEKMAQQPMRNSINWSERLLKLPEYIYCNRYIDIPTIERRKHSMWIK